MPRFSSRFISSFVLFGLHSLSITVGHEIRLGGVHICNQRT